MAAAHHARKGVLLRPTASSTYAQHHSPPSQRQEHQATSQSKSIWVKKVHKKPSKVDRTKTVKHPRILSLTAWVFLDWGCCMELAQGPWSCPLEHAWRLLEALGNPGNHVNRTHQLNPPMKQNRKGRQAGKSKRLIYGHWRESQRRPHSYRKPWPFSEFHQGHLLGMVMGWEPKSPKAGTWNRHAKSSKPLQWCELPGQKPFAFALWNPPLLKLEKHQPSAEGEDTKLLQVQLRATWQCGESASGNMQKGYNCLRPDDKATKSTARKKRSEEKTN